MSAAPAQSASPSLASRLGGVRVGLREDLEVSRHLFRGAVAYVVRDPITFQSQRLEPADYDVLVRIDPTRTLAEVFAELVESELAEPKDEEHFYLFVMGLHRLGFLRLPISDDKLLYQRYEARQNAQRRARLMAFLFLRVPIWNPDAFLTRTVRLARPLYSRAFFILWLMLVICAGVTVIRNWERLTEPLQGLLATRNLILMWVTLVVLKVFHEFGHAYACKHFGGHVPEMGIFFILFTPCAYVDATASWGFSSTRERLIVALGGMYVESLIAALAVFVWAFTGPSVVNSLAYNVMLLASVVTALFNINPLMRFDGYYILSDLTEVPNLRARSTRYVLNILKRMTLGIRSDDAPVGWRLGSILLSFGIAATLYRMVLLLSISAILAMKMFVIGMGLAVVYLGGTIIRTLRSLTKYLWCAEETAPVRVRAVAVGVFALVVVPALLILAPVPSRVHALGVLRSGHETVVRAGATGFLEKCAVESGQRVDEGELLARLVNDLYVEDIAGAEANLRAAEIRRDAYRVAEPDRAMQEEDRAGVYRAALARHRARSADLRVRAPMSGVVVSSLRDTDLGSYVPEGAPVATIASGKWQVRVILSGEQLAAVEPKPGDAVQFRSAADAGSTTAGVIARVTPAGTRYVGLPTFTHLGGGDVAVDPETGEAAEPYFEITIDLQPEGDARFRQGMTGRVRLKGRTEPIATTIYRRLSRFIDRLMQD